MAQPDDAGPDHDGEPGEAGLEDSPAGTAEEFEALLHQVREDRGFDFTGYKRASLQRRVLRRMADVGVVGYDEYRDLLQVDPDEFSALFDTVLINVTSFFRDREAWDQLQRVWLPELLRDRPTGPLRAWSAGCASGQEAYSLAILLAEALGPEEFRRRVKIYATDADDGALEQARSATYAPRELQGVPPDLLAKYFEPRGARHAFRPDLRRSVIFGRADLVQDAPISHVDLLLCRNTLMYLTAETQSRIAERLHYSLNPDGLLFLGKAELLLSHGSLFSPVDLPSRLFRRVGSAKAALRGLGAGAPVASGRAEAGIDRLRTAALATSPTAQLLLDAEARVVHSNARADALFGLGPSDVQRPFQDLQLSYRPVDLRSALDTAHAQRRPVVLDAIRVPRPGVDDLWVDVVVVPLRSARGAALGTSVHFVDVSRAHQLQDELEGTHRHLEAAYEELQSTVEELETTNEELQSTVEELETTNEELHSTNEELETMNEELQSMNDELQSTNQQLRLRTDEVGALNTYMEGVFASLRVGVVVVDATMHVTVWNERSAELWGVRRDEAVGTHLMNLDIGLPLMTVGPAVKSVLTGGEGGEQVLDAVDRRGRSAVVKVVISPLGADDGAAPSGAVVIVDRESGLAG